MFPLNANIAVSGDPQVSISLDDLPKGSLFF